MAGGWRGLLELLIGLGLVTADRPGSVRLSDSLANAVRLSDDLANSVRLSDSLANSVRISEGLG